MALGGLLFLGGVYLRERVGGMELGGVEGGEAVVKMNCIREE